MEEIYLEKITIHLGRKEHLILLSFLPLILIVLAFILDTPKEIIEGLRSIITTPGILLTDYIVVGGIGAAFINAAILALINIYIIYKLKLKINGILIAAIFTTIGFSFIGKDIFNIWPLYIGGYLYSKHQKISFKNVIIIIMFSTSLSPLVGEIAFGLQLPLSIGLSLGILFGISIGFIITPVASHLIKIHDGYNLYNVGFAAGIIGSIIAAVLRGSGLIIEPENIISEEYDVLLKTVFITLFAFLIILGYIINKKRSRNYKDILKYSGRAVTDFTQLEGFGTTYINMGIMGIIAVLYVVMSGGTMNGPIAAGILTVTGFAASGKHPKNTIPILIGVFVGGVIKIWELDSTNVIIAGLFGTTLAPVAGAFGWPAGIITGFIHLSVVMNVGMLHGGINLYNNGFSGGIVAAVVVPLIYAFKKGE